MADYLTYWRYGTVANQAERPVDHAGSEQFDTLFLRKSSRILFDNANRRHF